MLSANPDRQGQATFILNDQMGREPQFACF